MQLTPAWGPSDILKKKDILTVQKQRHFSLVLNPFSAKIAKVKIQQNFQISFCKILKTYTAM